MGSVLRLVVRSCIKVSFAMDSSMTSKKSANSKGSSRRPVGVTRQVSNVSARSRSTLSSGGSPKVARKGSTPVSRTETTSGRSPVGPKKLASSATIKQTRKTTDHTAAGQAIHAEKERSQDHLKPLSGVDKQTSLNLAKAKVNVGNRQTEKPKTNGTPNTKSGLSSRLSSGAETSVNKTSTPKERSEEKGEQLPLKRVTGRDINRSSARGKTIRSDSSDMDAASKLVSAKIYELRTELVNNSLITAPIKDFIGQGSVESFVVLPLGRFSQNSKSLWQAAMMELLLEIAVPKRRIFLDSSLIDLEKESLRSHAFVHRGDAGVPEDIEMLENTMGDFVLVTKSRKSRSKVLTTASAAVSGNQCLQETEPVDDAVVRSDLERAKQELASSEYWNQVKNVLGTDSFEVLVCLGLGQTCYSMTSRWQTAMLFLLKEQLEPLSCVAYDPLFASSDRRVLEDVGIETLYENNEGRLAFAGRKTLFFMPHCGRPLFNSVLYANRHQLSHMTIYGNSFRTIFGSVEFENRMRRGKYPALKGCQDIFEEVSLKNVFHYQDVFNDLSIIRFNADLVSDIPDPVYGDEDEIILKRQMENLGA
ncbi:uncharacterized protein LOC111272618 isoform X2 [Varroa jacobsoni]|uniref:uncharacterized protein LOC111272618 isoform X2 n=1 Tax=Varroa jacobsoni TaxID=62625 RepID=UPI000BF645A5|nr:uncharacterized protein LOC111272618 isoform X2 [Varroa jacobsoni]